MSIQDVLDELDASRGAFYHYFDSKAALLERASSSEWSRRSSRRWRRSSTIRDLTAIEKFEGIFAGIARWKAERPDLVDGCCDVWLSDENAIVREKYRAQRRGKARPAPCRRSSLRASPRGSPPDPRRETARVVVSLILGANQTAVDLYVARPG